MKGLQHRGRFCRQHIYTPGWLYTVSQRARHISVARTAQHTTTPRRTQPVPRSLATLQEARKQQLAWVAKQAYLAAVGTMPATTPKARLLTLFLTTPLPPTFTGHASPRCSNSCAAQHAKQSSRWGVKQNAALLHSCAHKGPRLAGARPGAGICPKSLQLARSGAVSTGAASTASRVQVLDSVRLRYCHLTRCAPPAGTLVCVWQQHGRRNVVS